MKYAVISDIHANPVAFEAVLKDVRRQKADRIVCLGDITGYGYDVVESYALAKDNCDVLLLGNHDAACAGVEGDALIRCNPNYALDIAERKALGRNRLAEIRGLPYTFSCKHFICSHGDLIVPQNFGYVLCVDDAWRNFCACGRDLMFIGHTHEPAIWSKSGGAPAVERPPDDFIAEPGTLSIVNVGSVGCPRSVRYSSYVITEPTDSGLRISFRRIAFDYVAYRQSLLDAGVYVPLWLEDYVRC